MSVYDDDDDAHTENRHNIILFYFICVIVPSLVPIGASSIGGGAGRTAWIAVKERE